MQRIFHMKLKKDKIRDLVYQEIKKMLLNQDLLPGQKVNKKELAEILHVSQTPVQESIIALIKEGLFESRPREGIFVKEFTNQDMRDFFAVRAGIEGIALRLCIEQYGVDSLEDIIELFDSFSLPIELEEDKQIYQQVDRKFHEQILLRSGNSMIREFVHEFNFVLRCYQKGLLREPSETLPEHLAIIKAIRAGNADLAQSLIMEHHMKSYAKLPL